jgi:hypothetical protein
VFINAKPNEELQFVKLLSLPDLLGYIKYFKPIYSKHETENILDFLLKINKKGFF